MAVIACNLLPTGREHELAPDLSRTNSLTYRVRTDSPADDGWAVMNGATMVGPDPIASFMGRYVLSGGGTDDSCFARRFRATQPDDKNPTLWTVEVHYTPLPPGRDPTYTQSPLAAAYTPLDEPPAYWTTQRTVTRTAEKDRDGEPILNSAKQPFDEAVEREVELVTHHIEYNVASAAAVRLLQRTFGRKLNSDTALGAAPEHLYCLPPQAGKPQYSNGVIFFPIRWEILENDAPWRREIVNRGVKHYPKTDVLLSLETVIATDPVTDGDGVEVGRSVVNEPVLLTDGDEPTESGKPDVPGPGYRLSDFRPGAIGNVLEFALDDAIPFTGATGLPFLGHIPALNLPA